MPKYFYTKDQLRIEKLINELGFRTELELIVDNFCLDIYIPELQWAVEVDGPYHMKKATKKRDEYILDHTCIESIIHVSPGISNTKFCDLFQKELDNWYKNKNNTLEKD